MQVFIILLVFASSKPSTSIGIYSRENSRLQEHFQKDAFFHEIKDWFIHVKNKIYDKIYGQTTTTTPDNLPTEVLDFNKLRFKSRLRNCGWHQVNLSTLTFDPDQDWGFRIGNWYFIRKDDTNRNGIEKNNSDDSNFHVQSTIEPTDLSKVDTGQTSDDMNYSEVTESTLAISTTTTFATQSVTQSTTQKATIQPSTQIDSSITTSSRTEIPMVDIEINTDSIHKGSAEVLMG
ncbi:uncharacterized protein LOC128889309 [Hylaeus anthracinus]|uniref:uncharacterized protein LOC128889309 n=1 Tax=Hylaeus anthracinus TaxID=313031 RepID=UPI0023B9849A|nr:uncharacterized protein LOC128889309 [Hylaeus anthracinus]